MAELSDADLRVILGNDYKAEIQSLDEEKRKEINVQNALQSRLRTCENSRLSALFLLFGGVIFAWAGWMLQRLCPHSPDHARNRRLCRRAALVRVYFERDEKIAAVHRRGACRRVIQTRARTAHAPIRSNARSVIVSTSAFSRMSSSHLLRRRAPHHSP